MIAFARQWGPGMQLAPVGIEWLTPELGLLVVGVSVLWVGLGRMVVGCGGLASIVPHYNAIWI